MEYNRKTIFELSNKYDPNRLLKKAYKQYEQINKIIDISKNWNIPKINPLNIIILGMGGSAIGGDLVKSFCTEKIKIPIEICRNSNIPAYVGENTLCIASSYSGNTDEIITAYQKCINKKAKVIAVSTGGELKIKAKNDNALFCEIPGGLQPRAALGYSFTAIYKIFKKAGILTQEIEELKKTAIFLKKISEKWENWKDIEENPPLNLALKVKDKMPVIYSSYGYTKALSYRWKCQFNENAKMLAYWNLFPEINHNEIVGWGGADKDLLDKIIVLILYENYDNYLSNQSIKLAKNIFQENVRTEEIFPQGKSKLDKLFYYILFGDLLTIYSAYLRKKEPEEIESIYKLKKELTKLKETYK